jgi:lycopene cyclase domain-containing protein
MSYLLFHALFILPPILFLWVTLPESLRRAGGRRAQLALPLISLVALSYTTPWDNYLVSREIWWYGAGRVVGTIGAVPVEEYLFFVLQPILTGLFLFQYLMRYSAPSQTGRSRHAWLGFSGFVMLTGLGIGLLLGGPSGLYMGLILSWASPLLAGMWLYDGETLWTHRRTLLYAVGIPTIYLWIADATAIATGIWTISSSYTLGIKLINLPVEEATFFLVTNLLVVQGVLLLLYGSHEAIQKAEALR